MNGQLSSSSWRALLFPVVAEGYPQSGQRSELSPLVFGHWRETGRMVSNGTTTVFRLFSLAVWLACVLHGQYLLWDRIHWGLRVFTCICAM